MERVQNSVDLNNLFDSLSDLVGSCENESAIELIDEYMIKNHYSGAKYAPRGYGQVSAFLANLSHASVFFCKFTKECSCALMSGRIFGILL